LFLRGNGRVEHETAVTSEYGSGHLALHRRQETDSSGTQLESANIAAQDKIVDAHSFATG
jgi:hypothetical protein